MDWLYVSIGVNVLLLVAAIGLLFFLNRAGQTINDYERFYQQTLDELEKHIDHIKKLMTNNVVMSDDDDVKKLFQSIKSFYQLMLGYLNAGNGKPTHSGNIASRKEK